VRALARRPVTPQAGVEWIAGSLEDAWALAALCDGASALVHLAGAVRGADRAAFDRVNVIGAQAAARAAMRAGVDRMLLVSSLAAREPSVSFYAHSKRGGEDAVRIEFPRATVLRPPAVYGPGDQELWPLIDSMRRGRGVHPGHRGRFSLIYVDDLVSAMLAWLDAGPGVDDGTYEIDDGRGGGYTWPDVLATVERVAERPVRRLPVPRALLAVVGYLNQSAARLFRYAPMVTPGKVRELYHPDWVCRDGEFGHDTGWTPRHDLESGLRETFRVYG
jgi:nucleoside-diphosphate-sugar epimerase